jgi:hypothetical protein
VVELTREEAQLALKALEVYRMERMVPQVSISGIFSEDQQRELQTQYQQLTQLMAKLMVEGSDG